MRRIPSLWIICLIACLGFTKCSSTPKKMTDGGPPESVAERVDLKKSWSTSLPGLLTDLVAAENGRGWALSTISDPDRDASGTYLMKLKDNGDTEWKKPLNKRVRSVAISRDGSKIAYSTYEGELNLLGEGGKLLWNVKAHCAPKFISLSQALVCWHDDDTEPGVSFDLRSLSSGSKISEYKSNQDLLVFESSPSGQYAVLSFVGGEVRILKFKGEKDFEVIFKTKIQGEVGSASIDETAEGIPTLALVYQPKIDRIRVNQELKVYAKGAQAPAFAQTLTFHVDQVVVKEGRVHLMGNSTQGQNLTSLSWRKDEGSSSWSFKIDRQADYSPTLQSQGSFVFSGKEEDTGISFEGRDEKSGDRLVSFPMAVVGGAYLYTVGLESNGDVALLLGSDYGKLEKFQIRRK